MCWARRKGPRLSSRDGLGGGRPDTATTFEQDLTALIPQLRAFSRTLSPGDFHLADDLVQDTLVKAWTAQGSFTQGTNLKAWVFTILRNQFYSLGRRAWRQTPLDPVVAEKTLVSPEQQSAILDLDDLRRAMGLLTGEQREAIILVAAGGFSYEEAADICGCALGTIKSRVSRAREALEISLAQAAALPEDGRSPSEAMATILAEVAAKSRKP